MHSLLKCLSNPLVVFFFTNILIKYSSLSILDFLYVMDTSLLPCICFAHVFPQTVTSLFIFLCVFTEQNTFWWNKIYQTFLLYCFVVFMPSFKYISNRTIQWEKGLLIHANNLLIISTECHEKVQMSSWEENFHLLDNCQKNNLTIFLCLKSS